jgi:hypothetical protein
VGRGYGLEVVIVDDKRKFCQKLGRTFFCSFGSRFVNFAPSAKLTMGSLEGPYGTHMAWAGFIVVLLRTINVEQFYACTTRSELRRTPVETCSGKITQPV